MGANFVTTTYHGNKAQIAKKFHKDQEQDRYENGHSYSGGIGMANGLVFETTYVAPDEIEASLWLDAHCQKWQEALAVQIKGTDTWVVGAVCSS